MGTFALDEDKKTRRGNFFNQGTSPKKRQFFRTISDAQLFDVLGLMLI